ncbi:MAG: bifunctional folylpolyglutamate synthase/dihydrofolate synthase [bacterium]
MDYKETVTFIHNLGKYGSNLGLGRIERLLERLGRPQDRVPVVHVAGTNGKGSTSAMIAAIMVAAGYRVGLYTSPHLSSYTERLQINGEAIKPVQFAALFENIFPIVKSVIKEEGLEHPTEFEILTAAALHYFAAERVDLAVMEVGLGGRLDATNIVLPLVSVITHIALDHTDVLGDNLAAVAGEKAGIIKPGIPVISAYQEPEAGAVIARYAKEVQAPLFAVAEHMELSRIRLLQEGVCCDLRGLGWELPDLEISLLGQHQVFNAATALAAVGVLREAGYNIAATAVRQGLGQILWPGRMELFPGKPDVLLDVAHNPDGATALAEAVQSHFPRRPIVLVFGVLADKDVSNMADKLAPLAKKVITTKPQSPRAMDPRQAAAFFQNKVPEVSFAEEIASAIELAYQNAMSGDLILICGSFYLVGAAREYLLEKL